MAAPKPAAALAERASRPLAPRAHLPFALAALRPRPGVGAAAPCAPRLRRPPLAPCRTGLRPLACQGHHRLARIAPAARGGPAAPTGYGRRGPRRGPFGLRDVRRCLTYSRRP